MTVTRGGELRRERVLTSVASLLVVACGSSRGSEQGPSLYDASAAHDASSVVDARALDDRGMPRLEIGRSAEGEFVALRAGEPVPVVLGTQGFLMLVLGIRAWEVDPATPNVRMTAVNDEGTQVAHLLDSQPLHARGGALERGDYFLAFYQTLRVDDFQRRPIRVRASLSDARGSEASTELVVIPQPP